MIPFIVLGYAFAAAFWTSGVLGAAINTRDSTNPAQMVFAHVIVGNTYPYTVQDWEADINLAHAYGIDAFALNVGADTWGPDRVKDAYVLVAPPSQLRNKPFEIGMMQPKRLEQASRCSFHST